MSEETIDFKDLLEITKVAFKERYLNALIETLSKLASGFGYYLNVDAKDVVMAYYDYTYEYNSPPKDVYVTLVLRSGIAIKVAIDKSRESNEVARVRVWVVPVE